MNRSCYGQKQVDGIRRQVKEHIVPLAERLHEERRKDLGVSHLYYCDELVHFAEGDPKPMGTPEEILADGIRMYEELSPETSEFIHFMMENELFDVLGYKDKKAGGYMTFLPVYQSPFVFANFNGTSGDTDVLTHEWWTRVSGISAAERNAGRAGSDHGDSRDSLDVHGVFHGTLDEAVLRRSSG